MSFFTDILYLLIYQPIIAYSSRNNSILFKNITISYDNINNAALNYYLDLFIIRKHKPKGTAFVRENNQVQ